MKSPSPYPSLLKIFLNYCSTTCGRTESTQAITQEETDYAIRVVQTPDTPCLPLRHQFLCQPSSTD